MARPDDADAPPVARALMPVYPLETERLLLRPIERGDRDDLHAIYARPDVVRFLYEEAWTPATAPERFERRVGRGRLLSEGEVLVLAVVVPREAGRVVGEVVLAFRSDAHRQGELGFVLHPDARGRGYASEAAREVLRLAFEAMRLHRVYGRCDARNAASARVMERLGMRREGRFREDEFVKGAWTDTLLYALLASEWRPADG